MMWHDAGSSKPGLDGEAAPHLRRVAETQLRERVHHVAAQVEFESKLESSTSQFSSERLVPGGFNLGLGSSCTALP